MQWIPFGSCIIIGHYLNDVLRWRLLYVGSITSKLTLSSATLLRAAISSKKESGSVIKNRDAIRISRMVE